MNTFLIAVVCSRRQQTIPFCAVFYAGPDSDFPLQQYSREYAGARPHPAGARHPGLSPVCVGVYCTFHRVALPGVICN